MNNSKPMFVIVFVVFIMSFILLTNNYNTSVLKAEEYFNNLKDTTHSEYLNNIESQKDYLNNQNQNNKPQEIFKPDGTDNTENESDKLDSLLIPEFKTGLEAYMFAEKVLSIANNFHIETEGSVAAAVGVTQKVKGYKIKDNNGVSFSESLSHSMFAKTGLQVHYQGDKVNYRFTNKVDKNLNATYNNNWTQLSTSVFLNEFGILPNQQNYVINKKTVVSESNFKFDGKTYSFTLELNPKTSTENYKKQVRKNADAKDYPEFKKVKIDVEISKNARFKKIVATEEYKIKAMGFNTTINSVVTDVFKVIHGSVENIKIKP